MIVGNNSYTYYLYIMLDREAVFHYRILLSTSIRKLPAYYDVRIIHIPQKLTVVLNT